MDEYAEKAKQQDQEEKERMQENDERIKQGAHLASDDALAVLINCEFCAGKKPRRGKERGSTETNRAHETT